VPELTLSHDGEPASEYDAAGYPVVANVYCWLEPEAMLYHGTEWPRPDLAERDTAR
jgi:hypothetical protein